MIGNGNDGIAGRTVVITAGGGALCGAAGMILAGRGAKVALWDIDGEAASTVARAIEADGGTALAVPCDCADAGAVASALAQTRKALGAPTLLINGAGGSRKATTTSADLPFFDLLPDEVSKTLRLNYLTTVVTSQALARVMVEEGRGAIVNIASIAGLAPLSRAITYSDGKAAVASFTKWLAVHLAREYGAGIRVNAVAPGFVLTTQNRFLLIEEDTGEATERGEKVLSAVPMGRYGTPIEIAEAAVWLLSDAASFVTGAVLPVDGGFMADSGV